jgi:universal stress protein A
MPTISLTRILVPTDFSDASAAALKYALPLADVFHAEVHVLHVLDVAASQYLAAEMAMVPTPAIEAEAHARADAELAALLTRDEVARYRARLVTVRGAPFAAIISYAREAAIDLIVMGTHGRGAMAHLLIGSVAENVVRKAPCPVLTIPLRGHDFVRI